MAKKIRDIAVKTGEYQDSQGQTKGRWQNVGALMKGDDGGEFIILHRWFTPAGVPNPQDKDSVLLSCFKMDNQGQQGGQPQGQHGAPQQPAPQPQGQPTPQGQPGPGAPGGSDFDDEIPFLPMHPMMGG